MVRPPRLTSVQKRRLGVLEPALRNSVRMGDYRSAKQITLDIQELLRPTGHETRLMQAKNWLFEAALEAGQLQIAKQGFEGVRKKTSKRTRVNLEATALLAICFLRERNLKAAEPLIAEVLQNDSVIRSDRRRRQFRVRTHQRFIEEGLLAGLRGCGTERLEANEIQDEAGRLVQQSTEDQLFASLGRSVPPQVKDFLLNVDRLSRAQFPVVHVKYLPRTEDLIENRKIGEALFSSIRRVLWRSICDPESDIYKAWYNEGMAVVLNRKYIASAVVVTLGGLDIGVVAIGASVTALIIKFGIEVFCDVYKPSGVMISRSEK